MHHTEIPTVPDGPNRSLPPLNPLMARSTIALILTVLSALLPLLGNGGVASFITELVANEAAIQAWAESAIRTTDAVIAVGAPLWFWLERRAPWRRLSFRAR